MTSPMVAGGTRTPPAPAGTRAPASSMAAGTGEHTGRAPVLMLVPLVPLVS
ncbi:hypothetical protein [Streptomyces mashuensis]|uniref:hypothetical protein n=1 Tax=Streptomyces mashuensis TaxID=33904 RepID=UPI00167CC3A2|nr:hypothetical protein [Streptomyces mashuensis]